MLAYDDVGNLTDDGTSTSTFEWDLSNRLRTVKRKSDGQIIAEYAYDAIGRRIRKIVTNSGSLDGTTAYYYDGQRVIEEHNGAELLSQQYVYGNYIDEVLVMIQDPGFNERFYHTDDSNFSRNSDADIKS